MKMQNSKVVDTTLVPCCECGSEADIKLYPNESGYKQKQRAAKALCRECWKKQNAIRAVEYAQERGFAQLLGTEKQVAWAEQIRMRHIEQLAKTLKRDRLGEYTERVERWLGQHTSAEFWIENKKNMAIGAVVWAKIKVCEAEKKRVVARAG